MRTKETKMINFKELLTTASRMLNAQEGLAATTALAVNGAIAYGTRHTDKLSTQEVIPAVIAGGITYGVRWVWIVINSQRYNGEPISTKSKEKMREICMSHGMGQVLATKVAWWTYSTAFLGFGIAAGTFATPKAAALIGREISYKAALSFSLITTLTLGVLSQTIFRPQRKPIR